MEERKAKFCVNLFNIGCIKTGTFTLKSGALSSYYFDLRAIISFPDLLEELCNLIHERIQQEAIAFNEICGVPYTALPISTIVSLKTNKPMLMRRKEAKTYGTKQLVEGIFEKGDSCIIIEDVLSSGASILETVADVEGAGLVVKDVIVFFNREEQGVQNLTERGYNVHCIVTLTELIDILGKSGLIDEVTIGRIISQKNEVALPTNTIARQKIPFEQRIEYCKSLSAIKIFQLMVEKQTNLCVAADVINMKELLQLAEEVGPHICILKIHMDVFQAYTEKSKDELRNVAAKHNFLIMEDRKLADIGNTVRMQFNQISRWASLVTSHCLPGFGVLEAIKRAEAYTEDVGVFIIAELSSKQNLITSEYTKKCMLLADQYPDLVSGVVCQYPCVFTNPGYIQMTPGVHLDASEKNDNLGQQYCSPEEVMCKRGADVAVVGRGIVYSAEPGKMAEMYKKSLWASYLSRLE